MAVSIRRPLFDQADKLANELQNRQLLDQLNLAYVDAPLSKNVQLAMRRSHRRIVEGEW